MTPGITHQQPWPTVTSESQSVAQYIKDTVLPDGLENASGWTKDLFARLEMGAKTYGALKTFNGREPVMDMYQEVLDGCGYGYQFMAEMDHVLEVKNHDKMSERDMLVLQALPHLFQSAVLLHLALNMVPMESKNESE